MVQLYTEDKANMYKGSAGLNYKYMAYKMDNTSNEMEKHFDFPPIYCIV